MGVKRVVKALCAEIGLGKVDTVVVHDVPATSMKGRAALITGGTSGIGLAIAKRFSAAGCTVVLVGTDAEKGARAAEDLKSEPGGSHFVRADVSSTQSAAEAFCCAIEKLGRVPDILVNSAGRNGVTHFPNVQEDEFDTIVGVNLKGALLMSQEAARRWIAEGTKGNILNVSSVSSFRPATGSYEMSKWGLRGLTLGMASDLVKYGIVVNAIAPGPTATSMQGKEASSLRLGWNPSGRMADPREIAELAEMLVSDSGRLIVGDTLCASGGGGVVSLHR